MLKLSRYILSKNVSSPISLIHFVTNACNARCRHCFVRRELPRFRGAELSLDEISTVARNLGPETYNVSLTGGEPTLREDLAEIASAYASNTDFRTMLITTNGYYPERAVSAASSILRNHPHLDLIVSLSLDEVGERHDENREVAGCFERLMGTYRRLSDLIPRGLSLNVNVALSRYNQERIVEICRYAQREMSAASISCTATRGSPRCGDAVGFEADTYDEMCEFVERSMTGGTLPPVYSRFSVGRVLLNAKDSVKRRQISRTLRHRRFVSPCYAGALLGVLHAAGDVYPCELLDRPLGNVRESDYDLQKVWCSRRAQRVRRHIERTKCFCTYECAWTPNVLFNLRYYPALVWEMARRGGRL